MIEIHPAFQRGFDERGWTDYAAVAGHFTGGALPRVNRTFVSRHRLKWRDGADEDAADVFYKHYQYKSPRWGFVGRPSKPRCEFRNYRIFNELGLPTAEPVACGEDRDSLGRLRGAFIITRAIPDAVTLRDLFEDRAIRLSGGVRRELLRQLADGSRRLHAAGFCHNDMVWRNLLVTRPGPDAVKLWWIDCPRGRRIWWGPQRRRKQRKDLAALDKSAFLFCRRAERMRFVLEYLEKPRLDEEAKRLIRAVTRFGRTRWPEDWVKPGG